MHESRYSNELFRVQFNVNNFQNINFLTWRQLFQRRLCQDEVAFDTKYWNYTSPFRTHIIESDWLQTWIHEPLRNTCLQITPHYINYKIYTATREQRETARTHTPYILR